MLYSKVQMSNDILNPFTENVNMNAENFSYIQKISKHQKLIFLLMQSSTFFPKIVLLTSMGLSEDLVRKHIIFWPCTIASSISANQCMCMPGTSIASSLSTAGHAMLENNLREYISCLHSCLEMMLITDPFSLRF